MNSLELEVKLLKEENEKLKECLENYNNSRKNYYEKNKCKMLSVVTKLINFLKIV